MRKLLLIIPLLCGCRTVESRQEAIEIRRDTVMVALESETAATLHGVTVLTPDTQRIVRIERIEVERHSRARAESASESIAEATTEAQETNQAPTPSPKGSRRSLWIITALGALIAGVALGRRLNG